MFVSNSLQKLINGYQTRSTKNDANQIKAPLRGVKIGDTLSVEVLKTNGKSAIVKMSDGSEMSIAGKMPEGVCEGMILDIEITGAEEGKPLSAEVVSAGKMAMLKKEELTTLLKELGINPNKDNLEIINDMYKSNIDINKENISKVFNLMKTLNIPKDNLLFLMKNDINVTRSSAEAFNHMISKSDFIEDNLKVLIDVLNNAIDEINNSDYDVNNVNKTVEIENENNKNIDNKNLFNVLNEVENALQVPGSVKESAIESTSNARLNRNIDNENSTIENINNIEKNGLNEIKTVDGSGDFEFNVSAVPDANNNVQEEKVASNNNNELDSKVIINKGDNLNIEETKVEEKIETETDKNTETLLNTSSDVPYDEENFNINNNVEVKLEGKEGLEYKNNLDNNASNIDKDELDIKANTGEEIYLNDENNMSSFKEDNSKVQKDKLKLLRDEVLGLFREVKDSKQLGEEISLKRIFKSFKDTILDIENNKELFSSMKREAVLEETNRMKENLNLISDLNRYNTICHIPLQINNNKSIAELYVFNGDRENSARRINENNATMFLSLGTANMGQIESYIKVVNKTVECNFMSESVIGKEFINDNKHHLAKLLDDYGYTLIKANADVYSGKALNIFEAIEKNKIDEFKKGFDVRA